MRVMKAWHACPKWGMALGAGAKCGSTMLAKFVQTNKAGRLQLPDARYGRECWSMIGSLPRVAIVRHPVQRFASLYANVQERSREPMNFYKQLEGLTAWDFFDKLIELSPDLTYDFHFQPQSLQLGPIPFTAVRLECFGDWVARNLPDARPPAPENESKIKVDLDSRTAQRVMNRYRDDVALWERAWASSTDSSVSTPSP